MKGSLRGKMNWRVNENESAIFEVNQPSLIDFSSSDSEDADEGVGAED